MISEDDVLAICREKLAEFKVPKRVVFYDAEDLPKTPTGKVQKYRLARQLADSRPELGGRKPRRAL